MGLEAMKIPIQGYVSIAQTAKKSFSLGFDLLQTAYNLNCLIARGFLSTPFDSDREVWRQLLEIYREEGEKGLNWIREKLLESMDRFQRRRSGELEFLEFLTGKMLPPEWAVGPGSMKALLDLPSLRVIDISARVEHKIRNYAVVFAPRAGHHSIISQRVALYMRDLGLTRMAIVEQKCADDIPLYVDGRRHDEGFDGQVDQYRQVLEYLRGLTGYPPHLIAICQPGPLLISTLILYPHLGATFGSAGSPMHMEAERGFLTDFARTMGEDFIDLLLLVCGGTVSQDRIGAGRKYYDGRYHVLGFYFLGLDTHQKNFRRLLADLRDGNELAAERQKAFYRWYNYVHHSPAEFISDTYKRIFVRNELIRGTLRIHGKMISMKDYPGSVPIWALGGSRDDIVPPRQATSHLDLLDMDIVPPLQAVGHMDLIESVPSDHKLTLICEGGHMGLFRSVKILERYYSKIAAFILSHSDRAET